MRIDKYIAGCHYATRAYAKKLIYEGKVYVNGKRIDKSFIEVFEGDEVTVEGNLLQIKEKRYFVMNKPAGYITATKSYLKKTIFDLLEIDTSGLFPVGRLDKDTEGLLIITDDGDLNYKLLDPKNHVDKTYYVICHKPFTYQDKNRLEKDFILEGYEQPCVNTKIKIVDDHKLFITIQEGRYHQVKKMIAACSNRVDYLKRVAIGKLLLDENLKPGQYREMTQEELQLLVK